MPKMSLNDQSSNHALSETSNSAHKLTRNTSMNYTTLHDSYMNLGKDKVK